MRFPASPLGPASIERRSTSESAQLLKTGSRRLFTLVGYFQHDGQAHARKDRRAPQHAELTGRRLFDLKIGRSRLMGAGSGRTVNTANKRSIEAELNRRQQSKQRSDLELRSLCFLLLKKSNFTDLLRAGSAARRHRLVSVHEN